MNASAIPHVLTQLSDVLSGLVEKVAAQLCAIRVGPNRHITGLLWRPDLLVTCDQMLPAQDSYTVVMGAGHMLASARAGRRDPVTNLAALQLDTPAGGETRAAATAPAVGALAVVVAADLDASPTARLSMVRRMAPAGPMGTAFELDLPSGSAEGGFVLDARGGMLGMLCLGPAGEPIVVPQSTIARFLDPLTLAAAAAPARIAQDARPWLGLALQPIVLPGALRPIAGQQSGRMVVSLTPNGPADQAGVRLGDILLAIDGTRLSGSSGLRSVLAADRIGAPVEVQLVRGGALRSCSLVVAAHP